MRRRSGIALTLALLATPSLAWAPPWPVTYALDTIPVSACGESWEDYGSGWLELAQFSFQTTEAGDCLAGFCNFTPVAGGVDLLGARLEIYLPNWGGLGGIFMADCTVEDHCGIGCTRVLLFLDDALLHEASNATTGAMETIWLPGDNGNRMIIASCGATVSEITIWLLGDAIEGSHWSAIKALYR